MAENCEFLGDWGEILKGKTNAKKIKYLSKYLWFDKNYAIKHIPNKVIAYAMRYADTDIIRLYCRLGRKFYAMC